LAALSALITENAQDFHAALWTDLRRNWVEADLVDVDAVAKEADYARQHLSEWMRPIMVSPPQIMCPVKYGCGHALIVGLLASGEVYYGGQHDPKDRYVAPTILVNTPLDSPVMQEEIFGPILPVLEVSRVEAVTDDVNARPKPLGLYVFAEDLDIAERILDATESGDAAVNDCTIQPLVPELPFGGVGNSGMGKYHGEWGFRAYTNARGVLYHSTGADPGVRYPPYPPKPAP
jgi:acyl-CoA reductase-like NAD-dependent aldehyde dehydrogenase